MKKSILTLLGVLSFASGAGAATKYSLPVVEQGITCQEGKNLTDAVAAFNSQFVGENANAVVVKGLIDKGEVRVRKLSDLTIANINGKIVICAIVSANR